MIKYEEFDNAIVPAGRITVQTNEKIFHHFNGWAVLNDADRENMRIEIYDQDRRHGEVAEFVYSDIKRIDINYNFNN